MDERIGTVAELWRYPVKSMGGERLERAHAGHRGLAGDRGWAVVDTETGKVASAKRPQLWRVLLECRAAYADEPEPDGGPARVRITLPDGGEVLTDDPGRDRLLSEAIGRPVTLQSCAREGDSYELSAMDAEGLEVPDPEQLTESPVALFAPPGTHFDTCTLHLIATATLDRFAAAHPDGRWDRRRFRPNVVVDADDAPDDRFAESDWVGRTLELGDEATAAVLAEMPRCVMTTVAQGELPADSLILRTVAQRNRIRFEGRGVYACAGVLTNVLAPGALQVGDTIGLGAPLTEQSSV